MKNSLGYSLSVCLAFAACGDDAKPAQPDAGPPIDSAPPVDMAPGYIAPMAVRIPLSDMGPDQLQSVIPAPDGKFYAAGLVATTATGPRALIVIRALPNGLGDTTFGTENNGTVIITDVITTAGTDEIDITTQPDGKVLVSAPVAKGTTGDYDIAVVRLNSDGSLDKPFGTTNTGIVTINLNDALPGSEATQRDVPRSITANADGIFVLGLSRGLPLTVGGDERTDRDYAIVKLTTAGVIDETFGEQNPPGKRGQFRRDFGLADTPRTIRALDGGKLLIGGYARSMAVTGNTPQPVLFKLTAAGQLDTTFATATGGIFHESILAGQTEVYGVAIHGTKLVTGGYGRVAATGPNSYLSLRFDLETGVRDLTWGGTTNGVVIVDPTGTGASASCRGAFALPNGKTLLIGSTDAMTGMPATQDGVFVVLDATGKLDTTYGTGINKYKLGSDGADQFWSAAVSGNKVAIVGWKGATVTPQVDANNDDAFRILFDVQ